MARYVSLTAIMTSCGWLSSENMTQPWIGRRSIFLLLLFWSPLKRNHCLWWRYVLRLHLGVGKAAPITWWIILQMVETMARLWWAFFASSSVGHGAFDGYTPKIIDLGLHGQWRRVRSSVIERFGDVSITMSSLGAVGSEEILFIGNLVKVDYERDSTILLTALTLSCITMYSSEMKKSSPTAVAIFYSRKKIVFKKISLWLPKRGSVDIGRPLCFVGNLRSDGVFVLGTPLTGDEYNL